MFSVRLAAAIGLGLVGAALTAAAPTATGEAPAPVKPVIGKPAAVPGQPVAGKRFAVSFAVTRTDTGAPLTRGRMTCEPSVGGRIIPHVDSFRGGTARVSFVVPAGAAGRTLKVKVAVDAGRSATRVATYRVRAAVPPSLSIGDASVAEGNGGTATLSLPVSLSASANGIVSVAYATSDGTATAPSDYAAASGTLTFQPGQTSEAITVGIVGDTFVEPNETLVVTLSSSVNAQIARGVATVTITNDDTAVPVTAGEYKGATRIGNYVFFSVRPDRTLAAFRVNDLPQRCGSRVTVGGGEDLGDSVYQIGRNGRFSGKTSWTGSVVVDDVEWTRRDTNLTGGFATPTSAAGTISVTTEMNFKGQHYRCVSGIVSWSAMLQG